MLRRAWIVYTACILIRGVGAACVAIGFKQIDLLRVNVHERFILMLVRLWSCILFRIQYENIVRLSLSHAIVLTELLLKGIRRTW